MVLEQILVEKFSKGENQVIKKLNWCCFVCLKYCGKRLFLILLSLSCTRFPHGVSTVVCILFFLNTEGL